VLFERYKFVTLTFNEFVGSWGGPSSIVSLEVNSKNPVDFDLN
jgi:hypothetical protein